MVLVILASNAGTCSKNCQRIGTKIDGSPGSQLPRSHLGQNLILGWREFLKRCRSTCKSVGKAVQETMEKV